MANKAFQLLKQCQGFDLTCFLSRSMPKTSKLCFEEKHCDFKTESGQPTRIL